VIALKNSRFFHLPENLSELNNFINTDFADHRLCILTDTNVKEHCLSIFSTLTGLKNLSYYCIEAGEKSKTPDQALQICSFLSREGFGRKSLFICLGGGVVCDLGGFLAGIYMRGIPFLQVPTSLLAMVDASTGGKTGVNLGVLKNYIGLFNLPEAVVIHADFLQTLPQSEFFSGKAEMIKHRIIHRSFDFEDVLLSLPDSPKMSQWIKESVDIKRKITEDDFREQGPRKLLNLGHTAGHALESLMLEKNTPVPHGYAIALGLMIEAVIAFEKGMLSPSHLGKMMKLKVHYPPPKLSAKEVSRLLQIAACDKKNQNKKFMFTLPHSEYGAVYDVQVEEVEFNKALKSFFSL
jgi:3-dehydroquinate synthase